MRGLVPGFISLNFQSIHLFPGLRILINSRVWWPFFVGSCRLAALSLLSIIPSSGFFPPKMGKIIIFHVWLFLKWMPNARDVSSHTELLRQRTPDLHPFQQEKLCRLQTWCWETGTLLIKMSVTQIPLRWERERAAFFITVAFITIAVNDTVGWYLVEAQCISLMLTRSAHSACFLYASSMTSGESWNNSGNGEKKGKKATGFFIFSILLD